VAGCGVLVGDAVVVVEPVMFEGCPVVAATWWARAARERAKKVFVTTEMRFDQVDGGANREWSC